MRVSPQSMLAAVDKCYNDPELFHTHVLGRPAFHPKQAQIARALPYSRYVIAPGAHSVGKSWIATSAALWFLFTRRPSKVIITSPSYGQLTGVMWESIRSAYLNSLIPLGSPRLISRKGSPQTLELGPEHFIRAVVTTEPERLQGFHGPHVMIITDESSLIPTPIWGALNSLGAELTLCCGNPIRARGEFREYYKLAKQGVPGYAQVQLTAFDSPHAGLTDQQVRQLGLPAGLTTKSWIDSVRVNYGEDSPYWHSRVLAEFPESDETVVLPESWLAGCGDPQYKPDRPGLDRWISCDPSAGTGNDRSAILVRDENQILELVFSAEWDLEECANQIAKFKRLYRVPSEQIVWDANGLGLGLDGYLSQHNITSAIPYKGSEAGGLYWANTRTACAMAMRERFNPKLSNHTPFYIPPHLLKLLIPELVELKLLPDRTDVRKQALEPRRELRARLGHSPDLGDVFSMSFIGGAGLAEPVGTEQDWELPEVLTSDQLTLRMAGLM